MVNRLNKDLASYQDKIVRAVEAAYDEWVADGKPEPAPVMPGWENYY